MNKDKISPSLVDSHAHLDFEDFNADRDAVLVRAQNAGVELIINVGFDLDSSVKAVELADKYSFIFAAVGIHPHDAGSVPRIIFKSWRKWPDTRKS